VADVLLKGFVDPIAGGKFKPSIGQKNFSTFDPIVFGVVRVVRSKGSDLNGGPLLHGYPAYLGHHQFAATSTFHDDSAGFPLLGELDNLVRKLGLLPSVEHYFQYMHTL